MDFDQHVTRHLSRRTIIVYIFVAVCFLIVLVRLWELQLLKGEYYFDLSKNNRVKLQEITAPRGMIYDRTGAILADNTPSFDVSLLHQGINELDLVAPLLSTILDLPPEEIVRRAEEGKNISRFKPIKIKKDVSRRELGLVEFFKLDLPNVVVEVFPKRHYPANEAAAHVLGRLGEIDEQTLQDLSSDDYSVGDFIGKSGVEKVFEDKLKGKSGWLQFEVDALGRKKRVLSEINPVAGNNIYLSIDLRLQQAAHDILGDKNGVIIALEPNTGDVLAYVSHPAYNPNLFSRGISHEEWNELISNPFHPLTNKGVQGTYPPGSVYKIITALAGLEEQKVTEETTFYCKGAYDFLHKPRCWKKHGHGDVDIYTALEQSCDVYFYHLGHRIGIDMLAHYSHLFGLGSPTGIVLEGEKSGLVPSTSWKKKVYKVSWQEGETLSTAIGQSFLLVTPLQAAVLINTAGNGGRLYKPSLIKKITTVRDHPVETFEPVLVRDSFISTESLAIVRESLRRVVQNPRGTGKIARIEGIELAGKTGTAQVVRLPQEKIEDQEIPYKHRDHAWFVAFAPFDDPKISVAVLIEHGRFGSSAAGPVARDVIKTYLDNRGAREQTVRLGQ